MPKRFCPLTYSHSLRRALRVLNQMFRQGDSGDDSYWQRAAGASASTAHRHSLRQCKEITWAIFILVPNVYRGFKLLIGYFISLRWLSWRSVSGISGLWRSSRRHFVARLPTASTAHTPRGRECGRPAQALRRGYEVKVESDLVVDQMPRPRVVEVYACC